MIVSVTGAKGGVGRSTVAFNLAAELDAALVDADLAVSDLPTGAGPNLHDVLAGRATPTDAAESVGRVDVLAGGPTLAGARAADMDALTDAVAGLARRSPHVVVDTPPGLARDVGLAIDAADVVVLVTTPTAASLGDARRSRSLADDLETPVGAAVLVETDDDGSGVDVETVESELRAPTITVPEREDLAATLAEGEPLAVAASDSEGRDPFRTLAATVTSDE